MAERIDFDSGEQIEQFYNWIESDIKLSANAISLWHTLLHITIETGKLRWLSIPIIRLERLTGMKRDAIYRARDLLKELNRIEYQPGKGSQAAKYSFVPFMPEFWEENTVPTIEELPEEIEGPAEEPTEEPEEIPEGPRVQIFQRVQQIVPFPPPMNIQEIKTLLDEGMEDKLLCEGAEIAKEKLADRSPTEKMRYYMGILRSWRNNNIKTYEEYQAHERQREEMQRNGSDRQSYRAAPDTPAQEEPANGGMREFRLPE